MTLLVVSPHCDDGVLGCGDLIGRNHGAWVVTVFAASPRVRGPLSDWDRRAGFAPGEDVMAARRAEDARALAELGATPCWLPYRDAQYGPSPDAAAIARDLATLVAATDPALVAVPLGLFHSDHALVHEAALRVLRADRGRGRRAWLAWADALYRPLPGLVDARLAALADGGVAALPWPGEAAAASSAKRRAVACYVSQLRALASPGRPGVEDAFAPELCWRLVPRTDRDDLAVSARAGGASQGGSSPEGP